MAKTPIRRNVKRWPWIALILAAVIVAFLAVALRSGRCDDVPTDSTAVSTCSTGLALASPETWVILAICAIAVIYSLIRLLRRT